jgi:hypothetical protein
MNSAACVQVLPLRVGGFVRRWTVGLWQVTGYVVGHYGQGENRYSELGLDAHNFTHVPLYTGLAGSTHVRVGHPVVATGDGADRVFIQVTNVRLENSTDLFHVSLNNPTDAPITLVVSSGFEAVRLQTQQVPSPTNECVYCLSLYVSVSARFSVCLSVCPCVAFISLKICIGRSRWCSRQGRTARFSNQLRC